MRRFRSAAWTVAITVAGLALAPSVARAQSVVHPAEYAASEEILWGCNDSYLVASVYKTSIAATINESCRHQIFVDSREAAYQLLYDLYDSGVPLSKTKLYVCSVDSVWMRDYGPFVVKVDGKKTVFDVNYYYNRPEDDVFPKLWASFKGYGYRYGDLDTEGGNFMTNGKGTAFISQSVYGFNNHLGQGGVNNVYRAMGCSRVESFEWLKNDGTTHIDMYAKLLDDTTVLVSKAVSPSSINHALLERNAAKFQALGYRVVRATMADDDLSTYTNSLFVGRTALVPTYGHPTRDAAALDLYRLAGYNAVSVDSRLIIKYGGAVHCISMQVAR